MQRVDDLGASCYGEENRYSVLVKREVRVVEHRDTARRAEREMA